MPDTPRPASGPARGLPEGRLESRLPDAKPTYTEAEARAEAERCLYCVDAPCIKACPTEIDIPTFIKKIANGNVRGSARTILEQNLLGYSCARVCPVEVLCVGDCVYQDWHGAPIAIGRLQRYATENATKAGQPALMKPVTLEAGKARKIALIGSGPASLACAGVLALAGHRPVILEKRVVVGGLNTTGIAPYKMQAAESVHEAEWIATLGVEIRTDAEVGVTVKGEALLAEYDAVFIGVGLGTDAKLGVPGEDGAGVLGATAWIESMKLSASSKDASLGRVVVVGGGNTAVDMARECARLGAKNVTMVYRRGAEAMSAYKHELDYARKEGVRVQVDSVPVGFLRDASGKLLGITVAETQNGKPIAGTEYDLACDLVGLAIGQAKVKGIAAELGSVMLDAKGCVIVDAKTKRTANAKVYAGGDCVNGGKEVVNAVAEGRDAARAMIQSWSGNVEASRG
jgi:glutamate synthase (NADPH/NADH) small chain